MTQANSIRYSYRDAPTLKAFNRSDAFIRGLMGPFGSGKSSACVVEIIRRGLAQAPGPDGIRRSRWAVIRNTTPQLVDTSIKTFMQWFPAHVWGKYHVQDKRYTIDAFEGAEIEVIFRALDRPDQIGNLLSLELTGAWINEAREVPWAIIEAVQGRVSRYPSIIQGGCTWSGIFMDTNPPDSDSKWFKFFEEADHREAVEALAAVIPGMTVENYCAIFKQPSGLADNAENKKHLAPGYYERLAIGKDPEWVKVYVKGEYGFVMDGRAVFPEYNDAIHSGECWTDEEEPVYRSWDFGLTPACVFSQITPTGRWIIIDEIVSDDMGVERFSEDVLAHSSQHYPGREFIDIGDPAGMQRAQTDEKTCFQILASKGIEIEPGLQDLTIRLESVRKPLNTLRSGKPQFLIHPRCKILRKAFMGGYHFRRIQTSGEKFTDKPEKNQFSHPMDALQYAATRLFAEGLTRAKQRARTDEDDEFYYATVGDTTRSSVTGY